MRSGLALVLFATAGCARKRDPAPAEMEELAGFMLSVWTEDRSLEDAMDNLAPWLDDNFDLEDPQFQLTPLVEAQVDHLNRPDRDLSLLLGAATVGLSTFDIEAHADTVLLADQVYANPRNYDEYIRTVSGDESAFRTGSGFVETINDITTSNFGVTVPYTLHKDYKWVYGREARPAIIARSWIPERGCNDGGGNCLEQSFSVDLWYTHTNEDQTIRFTATWSEATSSITIPADLQIAALANGMSFVYEATDEFMAEQQ